MPYRNNFVSLKEYKVLTIFKPMGYQQESLLLTYLKNQLRFGYSPIILFVGRQRSGKTALALKIASEIDPAFNIQEQMTFRIEDFLKIYDKYSNKIIILDEAGVPLDPYEHASITQRVYTHVIQTQAYKQNILFLVLPKASGIGKRHAQYTDALVVVRGRGKYSFYKCLHWAGDFSQKPPRLFLLEVVNGVPLPPHHIWDFYLAAGQAEYKKEIMDMQMLAIETVEKRKGISLSHKPRIISKAAQ